MVMVSMLVSMSVRIGVRDFGKDLVELLMC